MQLIIFQLCRIHETHDIQQKVIEYKQTNTNKSRNVIDKYTGIYSQAIIFKHWIKSN